MIQFSSDSHNHAKATALDFQTVGFSTHGKKVILSSISLQLFGDGLRNMAKGVDELVEDLVSSIAIAGHQGKVMICAPVWFSC